MNKLPPATLDDVCEGLNELRKAVREGLGVGFGSSTFLEALAICAGMGQSGPGRTVISAIDDAGEKLDRIAEALDRIAANLESPQQ
jgi:predicted ATPase